MTVLTSCITIMFTFIILEKYEKNLVEAQDVEDVKYAVINIQGLTGHICVGAYLRETWIFTTATCANSSGTSYKHLKLTIGDSGINGEQGVFAWATNVVLHPKYNEETKDFNAGLIQISEPFDLSETVPEDKKGLTIKIGESSSNLEDCLLYGWRYQSYYTIENINPVLLASNWTFYKDDDCKKKVNVTLARSANISDIESEDYTDIPTDEEETTETTDTVFTNSPRYTTKRYRTTTTKNRKPTGNSTRIKNATEAFVKDRMFCGKDKLCIVEDGAPLLCDDRLFGLLTVSDCSCAVFERAKFYVDWIEATTNITVSSSLRIIADHYVNLHAFYLSLYLIWI